MRAQLQKAPLYWRLDLLYGRLLVIELDFLVVFRIARRLQRRSTRLRFSFLLLVFARRILRQVILALHLIKLQKRLLLHVHFAALQVFRLMLA